MNGTVTVAGLIYESPVTEFPVRTGPGTSFAKADFNATKGTTNLIILAVDPDANETQSDFGRVYNWFHLQFPDGKTGWMRDHVIGLQGDFSAWGYGRIAEMKHAYLIPRDMSKVVAAAQQAKQVAAEAATATKEEADKPQNPLAAAAAAAREAVKNVTQEMGTVVERGLEGKSATQTMIKTAAIGRPTGRPQAIVKVRSSANTRKGPSTIGFDRAFTVPRDVPVEILEVQRESRAQKLRWFRIRHQGQEAWIREDLVQYTGDTESLGLPWDLYPAPLNIRWWVRDFNYAPDQDTDTWEHWGWDFGAGEGEPLYAGPFGGKVVKSFQCAKCLPDRPSVIQNGIPLSDASVLSDPGWGNGYGNYVIVGYRNDQLPDSTRAVLNERGFAGGSVLVMYGHMQDRFVETDDDLQPNQQIGTVGNSGRSEAPHLHLEVRMTKAGTGFPDFASAFSGLVSPIVLFNR